MFGYLLLQFLNYNLEILRMFILTIEMYVLGQTILSFCKKVMIVGYILVLIYHMGASPIFDKGDCVISDRASS